MKLPNWLQITWWFILVIGLTSFLHERLPDLLTGKTVAADIAIFGVWMALLLAPLFSEVTLLGITLKSQIDDLKEEISSQISNVRNDIRNAIDVRTTISPTINIPAPPADSQLPEIMAEVKSSIATAFAEHGRISSSPKELQISDDVSFLFGIRFLIEVELKRLARGLVATAPKRASTISGLATLLVNFGMLDVGLLKAIREVTSICTPAIHGEPVTNAQVKFVRDVSVDLITALRSIHPSEHVNNGCEVPNQ